MSHLSGSVPTIRSPLLFLLIQTKQIWFYHVGPHLNNDSLVTVFPSFLSLLFHEKQSSSKSVLEQWLDYPIKELNGIELDSITSMKKVLEYGQTIVFISELLVQDELANNKLATRNLPEIGLIRTIYLVKNKAFFDDAISLNFKTLLGELMVNPRLTQGANTSLKP